MPASTDLESAAVGSKIVKRAGANALLITPVLRAPVVLPDADPANLLALDFEIVKTGENALKTSFLLADNTRFETTATATTIADVVSDLQTFDAAYGTAASEA